MTLLLLQMSVVLLVTLACLVGGIVLVVRGRRDLGCGLLAGWALGVGAVAFLVAP